MSSQKHSYTFGVTWDCGVKGHNHLKLADLLACNRSKRTTADPSPE